MRKAGWLLASQAPVSLFQHLPKRRRLPLTKGTGWQKGKHFYGILGILAATSFSTPFPFGVFASKTGWHSYGCHECQSMEVAPTSAAATAAVSQPASQPAIVIITGLNRSHYEFGQGNHSAIRLLIEFQTGPCSRLHFPLARLTAKKQRWPLA